MIKQSVQERVGNWFIKWVFWWFTAVFIYVTALYILICVVKWAPLFTEQGLVFIVTTLIIQKLIDIPFCGALGAITGRELRKYWDERKSRAKTK
jgi:hypothetical protein